MSIINLYGSDIIKVQKNQTQYEPPDLNINFLTNKKNQFKPIQKEKPIGIIERPKIGIDVHKLGPVNFFNYYYTPNILTQQIVTKIFRILLRLGWNLSINGLENIPKNQNCVIMPNHVSHLDAPILGSFSCKRIKKHAIHGIGDEKLWYNSYFRLLARLVNGFPVRKGTKSIDIVEYGIKRIKNGDSMYWFPEGQRHKNPSENSCYPGKLGAGMLAHEVKVPIIPAFITGSEFAMPVGKKLTIGRGIHSIRIYVKYGKPVPLDDLWELPASKETSQKVINRIMEHIEALRPAGPYHFQR